MLQSLFVFFIFSCFPFRLLFNFLRIGFSFYLQFLKFSACETFPYSDWWFCCYTHFSLLFFFLCSMPSDCRIIFSIWVLPLYCAVASIYRFLFFFHFFFTRIVFLFLFVWAFVFIYNFSLQPPFFCLLFSLQFVQ